MKISKNLLKDIYRVHSLIALIDNNNRTDVNNPRKADKHQSLVKEATDILQKWINSQPPLNP